MQVGAFFEVYGKKNKKGEIHGSQIIEYTQFCELAIAQKSPGHVMAGFRDYMLDKYLKKIQDNGYTAVVYTQDAPTSNTTRSCHGIYSPGTYFAMESTEISNNTSCIWIEKKESSFAGKQIIIGMSNIDIYTGRSSMFEVVEEYMHNPTTYDELERYVSTYNPSEIIIITNMEPDIVEDIINFTNIRSKAIHRVFLKDENKKVGNCEKQIYQKEILNKFYTTNVSQSLLETFTNYTFATQSFVYLLNFIYEHNPNLVHKIRDPSFENKSDRMVLANHSLKQLHIMDDNMHDGKYSSVLKFLNNCATPMGKRRFKYNLLNPTSNIAKLQKEYEIIDYLLSIPDAKKNSWRENLCHIKDIEKLHRQIILKKITPQSLYFFYKNFETIKTMYAQTKKFKPLHKYLSKSIQNNITQICNEFIKMFKQTFHLEKCKDIDTLNFDENFIKEKISVELDKHINNYENSKIQLEVIRNYLDAQITLGEKNKKKKHPYVKIHETDKMGYSLQATKRRTTILASQIKKLSEKKLEYTDYSGEKANIELNLADLSYRIASGSNNTITSTIIQNICYNIISSKNKMKNEMEIVYNEFINKLQNYQKNFENIIYYVTMLDLLQNKYFLAKQYKYCKPVIKEKDQSFVKATGLRHCLIEHLNTAELYVTNDVELGIDKDGILLYGTNAVGKTSLIRALGICVIMAQSGLYVPCENFVYSPYKSLFTRILGNDNIFKGLSTFAVEMSELRVILKMADKNSLILGDELCSGTEIDSAISIFVSGLHKLHKTNSSFIFATHLHEIINYSEIESMDRLSMKHLTVMYNKEKDELIYDRKLKDGSGESMYGLEVCKSLHLPDDFLEFAHNIRRKYKKEEGILSFNTSRFNAKKIKGECELCGEKMSDEVHHLQYQRNADKNHYIGSFHKNHPANLLSVCSKCHNKIHKTDDEHKKIKTSSGYVLNKI